MNKKRQRLIDQARHLLDEIDALGPLAEPMPEEILSTRPLQAEPSIKEIYALIGLFDRDIYYPAIQAVSAGERPVLHEREDAELLENVSWNERPFPDILNFVRQSRDDLVDFLESLPPAAWDRTAVMGERNLSLFDVVYAVAQHDAALLRAAALRLHDIRLSL